MFLIYSHDDDFELYLNGKQIVNTGNSARSDIMMKLDAAMLTAGKNVTPSAELSLRVGEEVRSGISTGDGPVDAIFNAIRQLYPHAASLQLFQVSAVTAGTDAQAKVSVRLEEDGRTVTGRGADTDTLAAAAYAYVNALNKLLEKRKKTKPEALTVAR